MKVNLDNSESRPKVNHSNLEGMTFEQFYEETHKKAYNFVLKHTQSSTETEDIVQLAYVKMWEKRKISEYAFPQLQAYFFSMLRNDIIKNYRRQLKKHQLELEYGQFVSISDDNYLSKEAMLTDLEHAISNLPTRQQQIINLVKLKGYTHKEAAVELNISESTVEKHIMNALRNLRTQLGALSYASISLFLFLTYS